MKSKIKLLLIGCMITGGTLMGVTYHVAPASAGGNDGNSGLNWAAPKASISSALTQADVTEILVSNGTYVLTEQINVSKAVTIKSWDNGTVDPDGTVIDGNNQCRCFNIRHAEAVIDGFTIKNGFHSAEYGQGGGVYMNAGMVTNCLIVSNTVEARKETCGGAGVFMAGGGALWNCRVAENIVTNPPGTTSYRQSGGGVLVSDSGTIVNCVIVSNACHSAQSGGGGVFLSKGGYIDNCDVSDNYAYLDGGGIYAYQSSTITNCRISSNTADQRRGGGVYLSSGVTAGMRVADCVVSNNVAALDGGGVYSNGGGLIEGGIIADNECQGANAGGGGLTVWADKPNMIFIRNVTIVGNKGSSDSYWGGGGISSKNAWIEHCLISNNYVAGGRGGGVHANEASTIMNCRIIANRSQAYGGGVYSFSPSVIRNCLIAGNIAEGRFGGGIYAYNNADGEISNCTVTDNETQGDAGSQRGAGIYVYEGNAVFNCLVWSNRCPETALAEECDLGMSSSGDFAAQSNSFHYCCSPRDFNGARGNITTPPVFVDFAGGDYRLAPGSGGINAGTNMFWMSESGAVDLDGNPRIDRFSQQVDIGCYERLYRGVLFYIQ